MSNKYPSEAVYRPLVVLAIIFGGLGLLMLGDILAILDPSLPIKIAIGEILISLLFTVIGWYITYRYSKKLEWVVRTQIPGNYSKLSVKDLLELNKYGFNYKIDKPEVGIKNDSDN
jgi:hypothetical protein